MPVRIAHSLSFNITPLLNPHLILLVALLNGPPHGCRLGHDSEVAGLIMPAYAQLCAGSVCVSLSMCVGPNPCPSSLAVSDAICKSIRPLMLCVCVQIPDNLQCTPELNSQRYRVNCLRGAQGPQFGVYRGFAVRGKPDGRGQWVSYDSEHSYAGGWRAGLHHGRGRQVMVEWGEMYRGNFHEGCWGGTGFFEHWGGPYFHEQLGGIPWVDIIWVEGGRCYGMWHSGGAPNHNRERYVLGMALTPMDTP